MIDDMKVRNLSPATQEAYVRAVEKLSRYFGRSPDRLSLEDVRAFQVHLASQGNAWSTANQTVCALRFFYGVTLGRERMPKHLAYAHEPSKLPVVLSAGEVARFLAAVPSVRSRAADHCVRRRVAGVGSGQPQDYRHRQRANDHPCRARQGRQGSLCHAVSTAPRNTALLLACRPAEGLAVSWSRREPAAQSSVIAPRLPSGRGGGGPRQAGHRAHTAPQLCDASAGKRHQHPHHSAAAWAQQLVDDGALHASGKQHDPWHGQPARPSETAAAQLSDRCSLRSRWRISSAATARPIVAPMANSLGAAPAASWPPSRRAAPRRWAAMPSVAQRAV